MAKFFLRLNLVALFCSVIAIPSIYLTTQHDWYWKVLGYVGVLFVLLFAAIKVIDFVQKYANSSD